MKHTLFKGWTENQLKAEFAKAHAEVAGLEQPKRDAFQRRRKAAALLKELRENVSPR